MYNEKRLGRTGPALKGRWTMTRKRPTRSAIARALALVDTPPENPSPLSLRRTVTRNQISYQSYGGYFDTETT